MVADLNSESMTLTSPFRGLTSLNDQKILHNPRCVVDADNALFLFFTEFLEGGHKRISAARLHPSTLDVVEIKENLFPNFQLNNGDRSRRQGPTNAAPLVRSDGSWEMLFRSTEAAGKRRQVYRARAATPLSEWSDLEPIFEKGDIEDIAIWLDGDLARGVIRDIGGTVSGKKWPTIAGIRKDEAGHWVPDETPHLFNRSLPDFFENPILYHRVERPHVLKVGDRTLLSFAILPTENAVSEIRVFDWSENRQYLQKGETLSPSDEQNFPATPSTIRADRITYLSRERLESLRREVERLNRAKASGLIVEFGVALGGSGALMASAMGQSLRFCGYDVFGQIPPPGANDGESSHARYDVIRTGNSEGIEGDLYYGYRDDLLESVTRTFDSRGAKVDGQRVSLVKGLFEDTVRFNKDTTIPLAHIDCDWYEPTLFCLNAVAPHVPKWGTIIVDDFSDWEGCRRATHEFLAENTDFLLREVKPHAIIRRFSTNQLAAKPRSNVTKVNPSRINLDESVARFAENLAAGSQVLDAGSATAPYRNHFSHCRFVTCDISGNVNIKADLSDLPLDDNSFDAVLNTQVIEHVVDPMAVLKELARVLRPGGQLMLTAPFFYEPHLLPNDYYRFSNHGLDYLINEAGLDVEESYWLEGYTGTISYFLDSAKRALEKLPDGDPLKQTINTLDGLSQVYLERELNDPVRNVGFPKNHVYVCKKPNQR